MTAQPALLALTNEAQKTLYKTKHSTKRVKRKSKQHGICLIKLKFRRFGIIPLVNSVGFAR